MQNIWPKSQKQQGEGKLKKKQESLTLNLYFTKCKATCKVHKCQHLGG